AGDSGSRRPLGPPPGAAPRPPAGGGGGGGGGGGRGGGGACAGAGVPRRWRPRGAGAGVVSGMRISVTVAGFSWSGGPAALAHPLSDVVRAADESGIDTVWVSDH